MEKSEDFRHFARIGYLTAFYEMAVESIIKFYDLLEKVENLKSQGKENYVSEINGERVTVQFFAEINQINETEYKLDKEIIKIVIFLTTFLESYIWELAAITLGESFTKNHLDKLDTLSKWKIIPKLITGHDLNLDSSTIGDLKSLIKLRNNFIHHKTKDFTTIWEKYKKTQEPIQNLYETINILSFFKVIKKLFEELNKIDPLGNHINRINWYVAS
jgi:hypothetical protein